MAAVETTVYNFIQSSETLKYVEDILQILETIKKVLVPFTYHSEKGIERTEETEEWFKENRSFSEISFSIFGGFIRDLVAGISLEELKQKDVDVAARGVLFEGRCGFSRTIQRALPLLAKVLDLKIIGGVLEEMRNQDEKRFRQRCDYEDGWDNWSWDDPEWNNEQWQMVSNYGTIKLEIKGIQFDLNFSIPDDRFTSLYDYTCNNLSFDVVDGILRTRYDHLTVQKCVEDIRQKKLRKMTRCISWYDFEYPFKEQEYSHSSYMKIRKQKMLGYGYVKDEPFLPPARTPFWPLERASSPLSEKTSRSTVRNRMRREKKKKL